MMFCCLIVSVLKTEQSFNWCKPLHTMHFASRSSPLLNRPPSTLYWVYLSFTFLMLSLVKSVRNCAAIVEILSLSFWITLYLSNFRGNISGLCVFPTWPKMGSFMTSVCHPPSEVGLDSVFALEFVEHSLSISPVGLSLVSDSSGYNILAQSANSVKPALSLLAIIVGPSTIALMHTFVTM